MSKCITLVVVIVTIVIIASHSEKIPNIEPTTTPTPVDDTAIVYPRAPRNTQSSLSALSLTTSPEPPPDAELELLAKLVYGEARGCSPDEQALVLWTVFQRVDDGRFGADVMAVVTAKRQFHGYDDANPVLPEIYALCESERAKWLDGETPPLLPPYAKKLPYLFFSGNGKHNYFRSKWS